MRLRFFPRIAERPGILAAALFVATLAVAAVLAFQAAGAAASHRATAEAALTHHAATAAWHFAREGRSWVGFGMVDAANRLARAAAEPGAAGPRLLSRVLAEKDCDCMTAGFAHTVFRVTLDGVPRLDAIGEPLSERARDGLVAAALAEAADTAPRPGGRSERWRILPPGTPRLTRPTDVTLLWLIPDGRAGMVSAYGMIVDSAQIARPLRDARAEIAFFPPALVPSAAADSLVRIEVAGANRQPLFVTGPATARYTGSDTLSTALGGLRVTVAIHPDAARLLLAGGMPGSRTGTIAALLVLALALGGAALVLLRREHRLARLREDFVSSVSHELRTPVTQIRLLGELLQSEGFRTADERKRATDVIHREALRLGNLLDNVLEFARLRHGKRPAPPDTVSLSRVARQLAESLSPLLATQGARLELGIPDDAQVEGAPDAVGRVLRNLVENAIKYGPAGQTIRLVVDGDSDPGTVRLLVDDQGPGIPLSERNRIWQPYHRLDRDRNVALGGSGLGLAVVADLMRELGGRAWVEEAPGGGARFGVEFRPAARGGSA